MALREYQQPGEVVSGVLKIRRDPMADAIKQFRDGPVLVRIERAYATRSEQQNRWYWGAILPALSEHTGYTVDELHEYCKQRFNAKRLCIVDAEGVVTDEQTIGQSTTKLNKLTFGEYCQRIREWAARDLGLDIPDPDPEWKG